MAQIVPLMALGSREKGIALEQALLLKIFFSLCGAVLILLGSVDSLALNVYMVGDGTNPGFLGHYDNVQTGAGTLLVQCFQCTICHLPEPNNVSHSIQDLNSYGQDWQAAWVKRQGGVPLRDFQGLDSNADMAFTDIDNNDPDSDKSPTLAEIKAGSNPGDTSSTPSLTECSTLAVTYNSYPQAPTYNNPNMLRATCGLVREGHTAPPSIGWYQILLCLILLSCPLWILRFLYATPVPNAVGK